MSGIASGIVGSGFTSAGCTNMTSNVPARGRLLDLTHI